MWDKLTPGAQRLLSWSVLVCGGLSVVGGVMCIALGTWGPATLTVIFGIVAMLQARKWLHTIAVNESMESP